MLSEDGIRSRAHALPVSILEKQAKSLNIPLVTRAASWDDYEEVFIEELHKFKKKGVEVAIFGDIDLDEHRLWEERVCKTASLEVYLPLWQRSRRELAWEFVNLGFTAVIIAIKNAVLDSSFLGREYNAETLADLEMQA
jgi:diphthine-ammonia ligase